MRKFSQITKDRLIREQDEEQTTTDQQPVGFSANQMSPTPQTQQQPVQVQVQVETQPEQQTIEQQPQAVVGEQPVVDGEQPVLEEPNDGKNVVKFFSKLFESREMAHIFHLQVNKEDAYSHHKSLEEYYDEIVDLIDTVIEIYQGQYGIVDGYDIIDPANIKNKTPLEYFEELAENLKHSRKCICVEDSHIHGVVDEIVGLVYQTIFKLKFL